MRQAQLKLEKRTAGNGSSTEPKVPATPTAPVPECMGSDPGRHSAVSNPNPAAMCAAVAVPVNRGTTLADDVVRGMTYSASPKAAVNETHPANASVAVHRDTALTDDVDRGIVYAANCNPAAMNGKLTPSLCKLIGVVH